ncbi:MAG: hypothetical protein NTU41_07185 [Chloroflexi bacterium]|nr:hypothetical protein [Chloroflexota bacterium]
MPIRIRCPDRPLERQQAIGYKGVDPPSARRPTASYADGKPELRVPSGSAQLSLDTRRHKMSQVEIVGVYPVEGTEPCHLIELIIRGCEAEVDIGGFTQEVPGQPQDDWQVPYMEYILNADGAAILADDLSISERPGLWNGDPRLAFFFHYLDLKRPLKTPFGDVSLPDPISQPDRLKIIKYEPVD